MQPQTPPPPPHRDVLEGKGPRRGFQRQLGRRLPKRLGAVTVGYKCRWGWQLPSERERRRHRQGPWGGGGFPPSNASSPPPSPEGVTFCTSQHPATYLWGASTCRLLPQIRVGCRTFWRRLGSCGLLWGQGCVASCLPLRASSGIMFWVSTQRLLQELVQICICEYQSKCRGQVGFHLEGGGVDRAPWLDPPPKKKWLN